MRRNIFFTKLLLFGFLFLTISCQKVEKLNCETLQNLAGTWHLDWGDESRTFTTNYEYIDSVFSGPSSDTLEDVIKGRFKLNNGFIVFSNLKYIYLRQIFGLINSFYNISPTFQFEIIDDKLSMKEVDIFRPKGHTGFEIYGKWESKGIIIVYDSQQSPKFLSGNQIIEYDFSKDLNTYMIKYFNTYGIKHDSFTDGPFKYYFDSPYVYNGTNNKVLGVLKDGILKISGVTRTFTKVH